MIIVQFDNKYLKWGNLFFSTLSIFDQDQPVIAYTVNLAEDAIKQLTAIRKNIQIKNRFIEKVTPAYMANRKVECLYSAIIDYPNEPNYLLMDIDLLIRKPLDSLFNKLSSADAAIIFRSGEWAGKVYDHLKVNSSLILLSPNGKELAAKWFELINSDKSLYGVAPNEWFWDQATLLEATKQVSISYETIEEVKYINNVRDSSAVIWSANVPNKNFTYMYFTWEFQLLKMATFPQTNNEIVYASYQR